jgi:hypothetical protein
MFNIFVYNFFTLWTSIAAHSCNGCKQNVPCMTSLSLQLKSIEEKTHNKISILEQKMDDIHVDMGEKVTLTFASTTSIALHNLVNMSLSNFFLSRLFSFLLSGKLKIIKFKARCFWSSISFS